ncbi:type VII toxin-antitoxin system MntA family adenylyltransferase antitoxin [Heliorestis convoluta]|uniref:Nucleotidyltransferase domain protein n=1 Tax=Heliorestis convoluta TaxID=356322 RepID=A0A5Q2N4X9_9FIRM|nr:nucleotidyltransferase domain-containing protein [Heliorestis convoluta]QGG48949.1 nucleotidyltransferase domain protein [Heliorestis convoluta]
MTIKNTIEEAIEETKKILQKKEEVSAAYLFGSIAKGNYRANSDIDIAILFIPAMTKLERFEKRLELMGHIEDVAQRSADVIDLLEAPLFLQHQIRKYGKLIIEKDKAYRIDQEVRSRREYFDLMPHLERRQKAIIKDFLEKRGKENGRS